MSEEVKEIIEEIYSKIHEDKEDYEHDLYGDYAVSDYEKDIARHVINELDHLLTYIEDRMEYGWN